eukprot:scaffold1435_cov267-Pinguiococcus_pyrenoidosus.AAC.39
MSARRRLGKRRLSSTSSSASTPSWRNAFAACPPRPASSCGPRTDACRDAASPSRTWLSQSEAARSFAASLATPRRARPPCLGRRRCWPLLSAAGCNGHGAHDLLAAHGDALVGFADEGRAVRRRDTSPARQVRSRRPPAEPGVLQHRLERRALGDGLGEHLVEQVLQGGVGVLGERHRLVLDLVVQLQHLSGHEGRAAEGQHVHGGAQCPDVGGNAVVLGAGADLGGHEGRRAGGISHLAGGRTHDLGDAEVGDLDDVVLGYQQVLRLDVPVDDALVVEILEALHHLAKHQPQRVAVHGLAATRPVVAVLGLHEVATLHVLDHEIELVDARVVHDLVEAQHVRVAELLHDGDLALDVVQGRGAVLGAPLLHQRLVDDLHGEHVVRALLDGLANLGERAGAQALQQDVVVHDVPVPQPVRVGRRLAVQSLRWFGLLPLHVRRLLHGGAPAAGRARLRGRRRSRWRPWRPPGGESALGAGGAGSRVRHLARRLSRRRPWARDLGRRAAGQIP